MIDLEVNSLVGVGPVTFEMTKDEVVGVLGVPSRIIRGTRMLYFGSALQIHLDSSDHVRFIELGFSPLVRPILNGVALLEVNADAAIRAMMQYGPVDQTDPEYPRSLVVPSAELSLWQSALPSEDPKGQRFESVGCGRPGYFSRRDLPVN